MERHGKKSKNPLRAFFAALKEWFETPGFRGCAFQNAAAELADPVHFTPSRAPFVEYTIESSYAKYLEKGDRARVYDRLVVFERGEKIAVIPADKIIGIVLRRE
jgi:hypothetical protein